LKTTCAARQRGLTSVEFAICGSVFLILLFGCIEMGRLFFTWNSLNEMTRRAAKLAAVCPVGSIASVRNTASFNGGLISNMGAADLEIRYLDDAGEEVGDPATNIAQITFVQARISDSYQFQLLIPFLNRIIDPPDFNSTVPSESLGITPPGAGTTTC
jgi:Flp pilus assembly protein TadG